LLGIQEGVQIRAHDERDEENTMAKQIRKNKIRKVKINKELVIERSIRAAKRNVAKAQRALRTMYRRKLRLLTKLVAVTK
jgi:hypothetical protein